MTTIDTFFPDKDLLTKLLVGIISSFLAHLLSHVSVSGLQPQFFVAIFGLPFETKIVTPSQIHSKKRASKMNRATKPGHLRLHLILEPEAVCYLFVHQPCPIQCPCGPRLGTMPPASLLLGFTQTTQTGDRG